MVGRAVTVVPAQPGVQAAGTASDRTAISPDRHEVMPSRSASMLILVAAVVTAVVPVSQYRSSRRRSATLRLAVPAITRSQVLADPVICQLKFPATSTSPLLASTSVTVLAARSTRHLATPTSLGEVAMTRKDSAAWAAHRRAKR